MWIILLWKVQKAQLPRMKESWMLCIIFSMISLFTNNIQAYNSHSPIQHNGCSLRTMVPLDTSKDYFCVIGINCYVKCWEIMLRFWAKVRMQVCQVILIWSLSSRFVASKATSVLLLQVQPEMPRDLRGCDQRQTKSVTLLQSEKKHLREINGGLTQWNTSSFSQYSIMTEGRQWFSKLDS